MRLDCKVSRALRVMEGEGSVEVRDWRDMEEDCLSEYGMIPPVRGTLFSLCGSFFSLLLLLFLPFAAGLPEGGRGPREWLAVEAEMRQGGGTVHVCVRDWRFMLYILDPKVLGEVA